MFIRLRHIQYLWSNKKGFTYILLICLLGFIYMHKNHTWKKFCRDGTASMTYCFEDPVDGTVDSDCDANEAMEIPSSSSSEEEPGEDTEFQSRLKPSASFQERWLLYERQEKEDDYDVRNKQVH